MKRLLLIPLVLFLACEDKQEKDCADVEGGTATVDDCGLCTGGTTELLPNYMMDCAGECFGEAEVDSCDVCFGGNTGVTACGQDCADEWGGDATTDNCGSCDDDSTNDCVQDCANVWGGTSWLSDCGCVSIDNSGDDCDDCADVPNGNSEIDCAGVCDGDAIEDMCGTCDGDSTNNCIQDCANVWGGTSWLSDCGCVSIDNSGDDCDDCAGTPNGTAEVQTYWYDSDDDGLGAGETSEFCNASVEDGWVLNSDDEDDTIYCISNNIDCAGVCDGDALEDNCGVCDNDVTNDCVQDCAGDWGGTATVDNCDECVGGNTGIDACVQDCTGIWGGSYTDCSVYDIDGNGYTSVIIGSQEWLVQNLKVAHYNNGTEIPTGYNNSEWADLAETGAYAVYGYGDNESNAEIYGFLYNWYAVDDERGICPEGWHVPTDAEWTVLEDFITNDGYAGIEGNALKEAGYEHWWADGNPGQEGLDIYGFTGLPGGYRDYFYGSYGSMGGVNYFWSFTEITHNAWYRRLYYNYWEVGRGYYYKESGYSVRCVKD